jgi:hypothetical protein
VAEPWVAFDAAAEKRIRRIVYCGEQLVAKRLALWSTRYKRAVSEAATVAELDEALSRLSEKFPEIRATIAEVRSGG